MGKLKVANIKFLKEAIRDSFRDKPILFFIQTAAFGAGIIIACVFKNRPFMYDYYYTNAKNYYSAVMYYDSSCMGIIIGRVLSNLGYFAVFFVLGLSGILFPIGSLLTAYRGYIFGLTAGIFASAFGFTGVLIFILLILPQNLITTAAINLCLLLSFSVKKTCGKNFIAEYAVLCLIGYAISLLGAIFEALVLFLLLRPLNFYF